MWEEGGAGGRLGGEQDPIWACQGPGGKGLTIKVFAVSLIKRVHLECDSQSGRLGQEKRFNILSSHFIFI